jgi:hypothetical protein
MNDKTLRKNSYYKTSDLALAATISLWYSLDRVDHTNPHKVKFQFLRNKQLDELIESFWKRALRVEPLAYFNQLKILKGQIYGEK